MYFSLQKLTKTDENVTEQLNATIESLENDQKIFEDVEFQYLEEETDWLAQREDLQTNLKTVTKQISEKQKQIFHLEKQELNNHDLATTDTQLIEQDLLIVLTELELNQNNLKKIEKSLYELTGQQTTQSDSDDDELDIRPASKIMSQSLFGSQEILSSKSKNFDVMSKSVNENMFSHNIEMSPSIEDNLTSTPKLKQSLMKTTIDISRDITNITKNGHKNLRKAEELDLSAINRSCSSDSLYTSSADSKVNSPSLFKRSTDQETDPLLKLKYNLSSSFEQRSKSLPRQESVQKNFLNLSIESDDFEVNPMDRRAPSQDDIDRISKITTDSPISMQGASYKVKESIKEIERNRQILLAQQGSHVIEYERQKINDLKKRCHDEARAQYLQLQNDVR